MNVDPTSAKTGPYTWDDFLALPDDDKRELIDGELVEVEVTNKMHELIVMKLGYYLTSWAKAGHGGFALASSYKIRISEKRGLMPDVQFFRKGNPAAKGQDKGLVQGSPDLVVEIISPSSRKYDRVKKLNWYASHGVPEYWIIDPEDRQLDRLVLDGASYRIMGSFVDEDVLRPDTFEGLEIPLADLWNEET